MKHNLFILITVASLFQACSASKPPETVKAPVDSTQVQVITPEIASTTTANPTTELIVHKTKPTNGTTDRATAHDNDNALFFEKKVVHTGDEFFRNRFERPFTANEMDYLPDLDIVNFSITSDDIFFTSRFPSLIWTKRHNP